MQEKKTVEIIQFTDPVCTWCWGSEPLLRKLETRYQDQLKVKFVTGGLVKDIGDFYDSSNEIGGEVQSSNAQIAAHWLQASEKHGMPVKVEGFSLFSKDHPSSYPQNIAYKAAQMENQKLADKFLRKIREATAARAKQTNKREVLIELANESGLDLPKFIERLSDGSAEQAFYDDLEVVKKYEVRGFPTFLIRYADKEVLMRGYQSFDAIKSVIKSLAGDDIKDIIPEKTQEQVLSFIEKYEGVAPVEIMQAFDYSHKEVENMLTSLKEKGLITTTVAGNGFFIEPVTSSLFCLADSGICNI